MKTTEVVFIRMGAYEALDPLPSFGSFDVLDDLVRVLIGQITVDYREVVAIVADIEHVAIANGITLDYRHGCGPLVSASFYTVLTTLPLRADEAPEEDATDGVHHGGCLNPRAASSVLASEAPTRQSEDLKAILAFGVKTDSVQLQPHNPLLHRDSRERALHLNKLLCVTKPDIGTRVRFQGPVQL
jgi:hypothetical protein